ncbi:FHA domain-containing protein [Nesterenkonia natronophila]|uniref:FHA domain-containing protein n=1 Tax=Nesterenkonia natronophila TaxID=2174932 RepID=UPI0018645EB3|nr:FHA domain-containing protein [Nesterenkonia natronophila]
MRLDIDLNFSYTPIDAKNVKGHTINGSVKAAGKDIEVRTDDSSLISRMTPGDRRNAVQLADGLAARGLSLSIIGPDGPIVTLGAVKGPRLHRWFTRSQHIRLGSLRNTFNARPRRGEEPPLPALGNIPLTPWPPVPTFNRRIRRRRATTTHSTPGAGRPRLIVTKADASGGSSQRTEFNLLPDQTTIGSDDSADLTLAGLDPIHAIISHDAMDEYVLKRVGPGGGSRNPARGEQVVLRSGSRIEIGGWRLVYFREEYADHGRPYGGRQGGELAYQKPQYDPYLAAQAPARPPAEQQPPSTGG